LTVPTPTEGELLDFALTKLGTTKEKLVTEVQKTKEFQNRVCTYFCTVPEHWEDNFPCADEKCEKIAVSWPDPELKDYCTEERRGWCCRAREPEDENDWCEACRATQNPLKKRKSK